MFLFLFQEMADHMPLSKDLEKCCMHHLLSYFVLQSIKLQSILLRRDLKLSMLLSLILLFLMILVSIMFSILVIFMLAKIGK